MSDLRTHSSIPWRNIPIKEGAFGEMKLPHGYKFRRFEIPEYMGDGLERWVRKGILPGDFLCAVLANNFVDAVSRADDLNVANLPAYMGWLWNEAPSDCWGSVEKMKAWAAHGGLEGLGDE